MNKRLSSFLAAENITQTQLADTLKVAKASVSNILAGRNKPGFDFLESLSLHYPELSLDWLINGRGKMYKDADKVVPDTEKGPEEDEITLFEPEEPKVTALDELKEQPDNQRTVTRITLFFSDGTYQEFSV